MSIQTLEEGAAAQHEEIQPVIDTVVTTGYSGQNGSADQTSSSASAPKFAQIAQSPAAEETVGTNGVPNAKLCGVCKEKTYKYKCSRCYLPYCSLACSGIHKTLHPSAPSPPPAPAPEPKIKPNTSAPRAGTAAAAGVQSPFSALNTSSELRELFNHYPNLSKHLMAIYDAMQPPKHSPERDMREKLTGKTNHQKAWNQDRGLAKGRKALERAREAWGKDGEGVREYGELVLQIVEGIDAEEVVRRELEKENARIVKALLDGEM